MQWWVVLSWIVSISFSIIIMCCVPNEEKDKNLEDSELSEQEKEEQKISKMYNQIAVPKPRYYRNTQAYINFFEQFSFT